MAYNSAYTGAQIDGAVSTVRSNAEGWSNKQNAITASGVLKGDGAGNVTAAEAGVDYVAAAHLTDEDAHSTLFQAKQEQITASGILKGDGTGAVSAAAPGVDYAAAVHTQEASTITQGTFAGQVVANSAGQTPTVSLLRNSALVSTDTTPTVNGEINWTYA